MKLNNNQRNILKYLVPLSFITVLVIIFYVIFNYYFCNNSKLNNNITNSSNENINTNINSDLNNDELITIGNTTKIRVINYYDSSMFKGKKSLLIMFGTWCHNCNIELAGLADIVNYYKNSDINIVLVAHEYEKYTLIEYLQTSNIIYNTEIYLDLGRVIRKAIDPDASSVPVNYLLDENCNVVYKHGEVITLDITKQLVSKYLK